MAEGWLHQQVEVDIQTVLAFAEKVGAITEDFSKSLGDGVTPLMSGTRANFGGGVINEGGYLRSLHDRHREAAMYMIRDVVAGLSALSRASAAVGAEYLYGDALTQATVDDVYGAFTPTVTAAPATAPPGSGETVADPTLDPSVYGGPSGYHSIVPGDQRVVAPGQPGEFTIPADDEHVYDVPQAPQPRA